jgi:hypothetical protein
MVMSYIGQEDGKCFSSVLQSLPSNHNERTHLKNSRDAIGVGACMHVSNNGPSGTIIGAMVL